MSLQFTGTIPIWALVLLFLATAGLSVWLYRKHQLPTPWNRWLPACRVLALLLLILTLFQPVLAFTKSQTLEGQIPIIVDTSGSMSIRDKHEPPEQVDITWHMLFYDQDLRSVVIEEQVEQVAGIEEGHAAMREAEATLTKHIRQADEWKVIKPARVALIDELEGLQEELDDIHEAIVETHDEFEYLQPRDDGGAAGPDGLIPATVESDSEFQDANLKRFAENLTNGSGLTDGKHTNAPDGSMWLASTNTPSAIFDLGDTYRLTAIHVWNYNEVTNDLMKRGFNDVIIEYGLDDDLGNTLESVANFAKASGKPDDPGQRFKVDFRARYVKITATSNHGDSQFAGLSEVRFYTKPAKTEKEAAGQPGRIVMERYDGITGITVADLENAAKFPDKPDQIIRLKYFDIPRSAAENYGARIRGYLKAPVSGNYVFKVASDDQSKVYLSKDAFPKNKKEICGVDQWTLFEEYNKERKQSSSKIRLKEGERYYFEVLLKEGQETDHLTLFWERPDKKREIIPDTHIEPMIADGAEEEEPEGETLDFRGKYKTLTTQLGDLNSAFTASLETLEGFSKETPPADRAQTLETAMAGFAEFADLLHGLPDQLTELQRAADERLAYSEVPEVDDALERFKEMTRGDIVQQLLYEKPYRLIDSLRDRGKVSLFTFAEEIEPLEDELLPEETDYDQAATRLGSVVHNILNYFEKQPVAAMLVLSDGNVNSGKPTADAREIASDNGVPLITIGVGSELPPDDIAIDHIIAPSTSFRDDLINLNVVLKRDGYGKQPVKLVVKSGDEVLREEVIEPGSERRLVVDMSFDETEGGQRHYSVEAETLDGEVLDDNNSKSFTVNVLEDPIQTLLLDEFPRWESRYAKMMLERDKRIEVRPIFIGSHKDGVLPIREDKYPPTRDELFRFHIIVMGDVNPRHFTPEQLVDLRDFVVERGGTIMLMAGEHYMPQAYEDTPLAEIFPFRVEHGAAEPADDDRVWQMDLTEGGRFAELIQVAPTPEESERLWQELPGLNWVKQGIRPTSAAEYLVTTEDNQPVMLSAFAGQGKLLYLGGDSFWRWRYRARWTYHHRFWGQILLWATLGRTTGNDPLVKMQTNRLEYSPGEPVIVKARILDEQDKVMEGASAYVDVFDDDDELVTTLPLIPIKNSGGEYRTTVKDMKRGNYYAVPRVTEHGNRKFEGDVKFVVKDLPTSEYIDLSLNDTVLRQMGSEYHAFHLADAILEGVERADETIEKRTNYDLWNIAFYILLVAAALLGIEWQIRKRSRLL